MRDNDKLETTTTRRTMDLRRADEGLNESFHFTSHSSAALQMEKDRIWGSADSLLKQYSE